MNPNQNQRSEPQGNKSDSEILRTIHVIVKNKNGTLVDEDVNAVSSYNEIGLFDVLPLHTHFISLIRKKLIIHKGKNGEDREMEIGTGLMRVTDNQVFIYLGLPDTETYSPKSK